MKFLIELPILLPRRQIILNPVTESHTESVIWNLIACTISGRLSERKASLEKLERYWQQAGENPQLRPIIISLKDTLSTDIPKDGMLWIKILHILSFLSHYIMRKISFYSIFAKSAISTLISHVCKLGEDTLISRFMRGVYNLRPFIQRMLWYGTQRKC